MKELERSLGIGMVRGGFRKFLNNFEKKDFFKYINEGRYLFNVVIIC